MKNRLTEVRQLSLCHAGERDGTGAWKPSAFIGSGQDFVL